MARPDELLPPEIWHKVFDILDVEHARILRLVCRPFRLIGDCHAFRELVVYPYFGDFDFIRRLLSNPSIAHNVKSLVYVGHMLQPPHADYNRFSQVHRGVEFYHVDPGSGEGRLVSRALTDDFVRSKYTRYNTTLEQQTRMLDEHLDYAFMADILPMLTGLESITMSHGGRWVWKSLRSPFDAYTPPPTVGHPLWKQIWGEYYLLALLAGLKAGSPRRNLHSLRAGEIGYMIFDRPPAELRQLSDLLTHLAVLEIEINTGLGPFSMGPETDKLPYCRDLMSDGRVASFLASFKHLKRLGFGFNIHDGYREDWFEYPAKLHDIIKPGHRWPRLAHLRLDSFECRRQELQSVLVLHRETLRGLELTHVSLQDTSWRLLLPQIAERLDLRTATLSGLLCGEAEGEELVAQAALYDDDPPEELWDLLDPPNVDKFRDRVSAYLTGRRTRCPLKHENIGFRTYEDIAEDNSDMSSDMDWETETETETETESNASMDG